MCLYVSLRVSTCLYVSLRVSMCLYVSLSRSLTMCLYVSLCVSMCLYVSLLSLCVSMCLYQGLWQCVSTSSSQTSGITAPSRVITDFLRDGGSFTCNHRFFWIVHTLAAALWYMWASPVTYWTTPITHMNESCRTYEWVMSHMNESCHTWMSHVTHVNESCHTYERVMSHSERLLSHIWISQGNMGFFTCDTTALYSQLQIGWHSILRLFRKTFNLVPGVPGFSWDSLFITRY